MADGANFGEMFRLQTRLPFQFVISHVLQKHIALKRP